MNNKPVILLLIFCLLLLIPTRAAAEANILVFHRFNDQRYPATSISTDKLTELFNYLETNNYRVVSLAQVVNRLQQGRKIPDKTVVLTIDDGYESFYQHGLEVFKEYDYPFTIFIATKPINHGYGDFLSWQQLEEIKQYGTIGSHSYDHQHLTTLAPQQVKENIEQSIEELQQQLGIKPQFFSYPYGEYNQTVQTVVSELGFAAGLTQNLGAVAQESDQLQLARIAVTNDSNFQERLSYHYLPADWIGEEEMVADDKLVKVQLTTKPEINRAQLYISGHGWRRVDLNQGQLDLELDLELKYRRNRIFLKTYRNEITSKLIIQD